MILQVRPQRWFIGAPLLALAIAWSGSSSAQQGWWEPIAPPPPPGPVYVDPPPVIYGEPPPGWYDAPPFFGDGPGYAPEPLPRGRLVIGPDGIYRVEPLPGEGYDDPRLARPDDEFAPYPGGPYPGEAYPGEPYVDRGSRAWIQGAERDTTLSNRSHGGGWDLDGFARPDPGYDQAPSLDAPTRSNAGPPPIWRQFDVISVYAPAKRAAVGESDPMKRNTAIKKANAWLVSNSALPATATTIRAIDKLLGIDVTDERTTDLPGAGTTVERPAVKAPVPPDDAGMARLADFVDARLATADAAAITAALGGKPDAAPDAEEIAGLDAFFGLGGDETVVHVPGRGASQAIQ